MGSGIFKGGLTNHRSLAENLPIVEEKWELSNGCFGKHPKGNHRLVTDIESEDPIKTANEFYDKMAFGGKTYPIFNNDGSIKGEVAYMKDGSIITIRIITKTEGKPAVDINVDGSNQKDDLDGLKSHKIHFTIKEENQND